MALVVEMRELRKERNAIHEEVDCTFSIISFEGERYLQLDTYGSPGRKLRGKVSQSMQFTKYSAEQLRRLIEQTFPDLRQRDHAAAPDEERNGPEIRSGKNEIRE